jgi:carboxyl-terminal processing protease
VTRRRGDVGARVLVLVDAHTKSAAEAFAGSLETNGRAAVVGGPTFGKASAQSVGAANGRLETTTVLEVRLPGGASFEGVGVGRWNVSR